MPFLDASQQRYLLTQRKTLLEELAGDKTHARNEADRLQALRKYRVLDTPPEAAFDQLTQLAGHIEFPCRPALLSSQNGTAIALNGAAPGRGILGRHIADKVVVASIGGNWSLLVRDGRTEQRVARRGRVLLVMENSQTIVHESAPIGSR